MDAAEEWLRVRPYRELSVEGLMAHIGRRRTVFYRHFRGLPDLVVAVLQRQAAHSVGVTEAFEGASEAVIDLPRAREILRPAVDFWVANGRLVAALRDAAIYDGLLARVAAGTQGQMEQAILTGLTARRAAGALQSVDLTEIARLLSTMSQNYLLYALGRNSIDPEVVLDTLALGWVAIVNAP